MSDLASVADLPRWHPPLAVLEFAELVLSGILPALPEGLPQPPEPGPVVLEDAEGTPVALLVPNGNSVDGGRAQDGGRARDGGELLDGGQALDGGRARDGGRASLSPLQPFAHGPLRRARRTAAQVKQELGDVPGGLAVPLTGSLSTEAVKTVEAAAADSGEKILWVAVVGEGRTRDLPPVALWRAVQVLARETGGIAVPLVMPVGPPGTDDEVLIARAAGAFGGTAMMAAPGQELGVGSHPSDQAGPSNQAGPSHQLGHPASMHPAFEQEWRRVASPGRYPGATIFFTGLSGSGKSTVAKALAERITEGDDETPARVVSLLDGDEVRRMLSAGLGFSRADRDLNILRIGWVAAEITRHGGLAVCAPIAPFDQTRQQVREMVGAMGEFVLIHVNTPLEECERRDRKGLYAKARAGEIPEFTGISSPYEEPADADLHLDTSTMTLDDAVERVLALIQERGLLTAL